MNGRKLNVSLLMVVRGNAGFLAFSSLLGQRIAEGRSVDAFRMLQDVGATPAVAHEIVEGWITEANQCAARAGLTAATEAACRIACFVGALQDYDWPALLARAVTAAHAAGRAEPGGPEDPESIQVRQG